MMYVSLNELEKDIARASLKTNGIHTSILQKELIDKLIYTAEFAEEDSIRTRAKQIIRDVAKKMHIIPSSIIDLYLGIGQGTVKQVCTVPAMNVRSLTYDFARLVFRLIEKRSIGPVVFEIARTEAAYTGQHPDDFVVAILAAAIKENYSGPVFMQADHMQLSAKNYAADKNAEVESIKSFVKSFIDAGFYNIDIDASTLVDLRSE